MSVVVETTLGDVTVDLFVKERPRACLNFLKLCKLKYYNYNLFHTINRGFIAQTGDPTGSRHGGESVFGVLQGPLKRYFESETIPRIKHTRMGLVSFVGSDNNMIGSQFFITLAPDLTYLDEKHCVFGEVVEGLDVLELLNEAICDNDSRPYQDIRITHTVILDDPFPNPKSIKIPERSPSPSAERLQGGRIAPDEEIDETVGRSLQEVAEMTAEREAKARATILEMVGDIPDIDVAPPENVLFVCKLNPVTTDDDLEIIFSRFGKIKSCEVIRDKKTGDSLQYAFVEFEEQKSCEDAYFKMDNVLIDDRRIHVDFSQSVAKVKWHGKGRGVTHYDDNGKRRSDDGRSRNKYKGQETETNHKKYSMSETSRDTSSQRYRYDRESYSYRSKKSPDRSSRYRASSGKKASPDRRYVNKSDTYRVRKDERRRSRSKERHAKKYTRKDIKSKQKPKDDKKHRRDTSESTESEDHRQKRKSNRIDKYKWDISESMSDSEEYRKKTAKKNKNKRKHSSSDS